jgi:hypothetical protein
MIFGPVMHRSAEMPRFLIFGSLRAPRGSSISHHYDGDLDLLTTNTSFDWGGGGRATDEQYEKLADGWLLPHFKRPGKRWSHLRN